MKEPALLESVSVLVGGRIRNAVIDTTRPTTNILAKYSKGSDAHILLKLSSGVDVPGEAKSLDQEDMGFAVILGMDVLRNTVLVLDHAKRFALLSTKEWETASPDLIGLDAAVVKIVPDVNGVPCLPLTIGSSPTLGLLALDLPSLSLQSTFATSAGLKMTPKHVATPIGPDFIGFAQGSISLAERLTAEPLEINIMADGAFSNDVPLQAFLGAKTFSNHLVVFDFGHQVVYMTPK